MYVYDDKEHRCAVHMDISNQPTVIDVAHDTLDAVKGVVDVRCIVHRENNAGDDHDDQANAC